MAKNKTLARGRSVFLQNIFGLVLLGGVLSSCSPRLNSTPKSAGEETSSTTTSTTAAAPGDTTAPTVTAVVATNADGGYVVGDTITIEVTFSEAVTVVTTGGTPYIKLETGTTDRNASYVSGSATTTLTFSHVLVSGDQNADLDYQSTAALQANGGTIKDAAGNDATLTLAAIGATNSISDNQAVVVCAQTTHTALGSGTRASPHLLCQADQLASVGATSGDWGLHYKLMHNIDLTGYTQAADGTQWVPIGTSATPFTGTFDGNFKTLSNLTYTDLTRDYVSIFGYLAGGRAEVKNLTVTGLNLSGNSYTGGVVGYIDSGQVVNVSVAGTITADNTITGGIAGYLTGGGVIGDSKSSVTITTTHSNVGGIVGTSQGHIFNAFNTGNVQGTLRVGGITGNARGAIANSYNSGNVTGTANEVGGISGTTYVLRIANSFSTGNVTGVANGASTVGALVGSNGAAVTWANSYYSSAATITNSGTGNATNTTGGTSVALATFYDSTQAPLSSWNFTDTWASSGSALPTLAPTFLSSSWGTCATHTADTPYAGGAGTLSNPYLICTGAQMNAIGSSTANWTGKHYKLMDDISLSAYTGTQYNVIGTSANKFYLSTFNGNAHTISDFTFSDATRANTGLFGFLESSVIWTVGLISPSVTGAAQTGAIAGTTNLTNTTNSFVKGGTVSGAQNVGGLIGQIGGADAIRNCYTSAAVTATTNIVGGVAGFGNAYVKYVFTTGNVTAPVASANSSRTLGLDNGGVTTQAYYNSNSTCTNCSAAANGGTAVDVGGVDPASYFYDKTKAPLSSWDFTNTWLENAADYPSFQP